MRVKKLGGLAVILLGGVGFFLVHEHGVRIKLNEENQALRQQMEQLAAENDRFSNAAVRVNSPALSNEQLSELLRLRSEVGRLRNTNKELSRLGEENQQLRYALAGRIAESQTATQTGSQAYWPKDSWTFSGYSTPESAMQSALWAAGKGDLRNFRASITGDAQKQVEEDLSKKPESEIAEQLGRETIKLNSVLLLSKELLADDVAQLTVRMDGEHSETNKFSFRKIDNEWKLAGQGPAEAQR